MDRRRQFEIEFREFLKSFEMRRRWRPTRLFNSQDQAALRIVNRLVRKRAAAIRSGTTPRRLVSYRDEFRWLMHTRPLPGLRCSLYEQDDFTRCLGIWLLGRCSRTAARELIAALGRHPHRAVRKEVARALRRMNAYHELEKLAKDETDPQVRRLATLPKRKAFANRMNTYLAEDVHRVTSGPLPIKSRMPLRIFVGLSGATPAKTAKWIRRLLEDIRRLVHGGAVD